MNDNEYDPEADPMENVGRALFLIARNIGSLATHVKYLGTGNAATEMGAIEMLAVKVQEGAENIASAIRSAGFDEGGIGDGLQGIAGSLTTDSTIGGSLAEKVESLGDEIRNLAEATRGNDDPIER